VIISGEGSEPVRIGSNCVLTGCTILAHDASANFHLGLKYGDPSIKLPVIIEDNCFIGYGSIILMGVTVGHDSVVGAGAIVTKNVPPRSVVAGNPAKVICSIDEFVEKRRKQVSEYSKG
jgi:acetyltransferase-like isoleucine patch superfamily enzyme